MVAQRALGAEMVAIGVFFRLRVLGEEGLRRFPEVGQLGEHRKFSCI